jgi:UDP-N-acetylglucosamine transferase subunit ALG13
VIFVTVGTNEAPFDRLVAAVGRIEARGEEIVVQHGASIVRPANAACVEFMPFESLVEHVRRARVVVTHAGVGSVLVALGERVRPIVVPRLARYGEAVDDHQLSFGRRFAEAGLVRLAEDPALLPAFVAADARPAAAAPLGGSALGAELQRFVDGVVSNAGR